MKADKSFEPMLAERNSVHLWHESLRLPVYVSPKLDGIRCVIRDGKALTRKLLPIANNYVRECLSIPELDGLDGEVIVGSPTSETAYNATQCILGNKVKEPDFAYYVFDYVAYPNFSYAVRMGQLADKLSALHLPFQVILVSSNLANTWESVQEFEALAVNQGYEGVILRTPFAEYKYGRSTKKEQGMLKLKRFVDGEAEIIGFEELMRNVNEAQEDAFGRIKRSSAAENLIPGGTLGAFVVRDLAIGDIAAGVEFRIGMFKGLTAADKQEIWNNRDNYLGRITKYSHFPVGVIDRPRHAKFIGFRDKADM